MSDFRRTDTAQNSKFHFRVSRFFVQADLWYFNTREGTTEGPFCDRMEAERSLDRYIKVVNSGYYGNARELQLEPIEMS